MPKPQTVSISDTVNSVEFSDHMQINKTNTYVGIKARSYPKLRSLEVSQLKQAFGASKLSHKVQVTFSDLTLELYYNPMLSDKSSQLYVHAYPNQESLAAIVYSESAWMLGRQGDTLTLALHKTATPTCVKLHPLTKDTNLLGLITTCLCLSEKLLTGFSITASNDTSDLTLSDADSIGSSVCFSSDNESDTEERLTLKPGEGSPESHASTVTEPSEQASMSPLLLKSLSLDEPERVSPFSLWGGKSIVDARSSEPTPFVHTGVAQRQAN